MVTASGYVGADMVYLLNLLGLRRILLRDWNTGKVPFYTKPPTLQKKGKEAGLVSSDSKILTKLGEEFDVLRDGDAKVREIFHDTADRSLWLGGGGGGGGGCRRRRTEPKVERVS